MKNSPRRFAHQLKFICWFFLATSVSQCAQRQLYDDPIQGKINGLVFTGPGQGPLQEQIFASMKEVNANFVAIVPEATVYRQNLKVVYDFENQWYGEKKIATLEGIELAKAQGLKIMLKPHLTVGWDMSKWVRPELDVKDSLSRAAYSMSARDYINSQESKVEGKGSWRGEFMTRKETDWEVFEQGYEAFILDYAKIADSLNVELFCIGTEMKRAALEKPEFWVRLVEKVRKVYDGPITYAANWDSYNKISFWDKLDYIGVDAYFPLSQSQDPDSEELEEGWIDISQSLAQLSEKFELPLILTEWGYENEDFVGAEPWIMGRFQNASNAVNNPAQARAYQSMFESIWRKPWMKGVFVWRWSTYPDKSQWPNYSPRNKEASNVLKEWFGKKQESSK